MSPKLPSKLSSDGLLIGYSLDEEQHRPVMGFRFGEAIEDEDPDDDMLEPVLHTGDGHLITLARTGAGKGIGCTIPALLRYDGPVIVIDPSSAREPRSPVWNQPSFRDSAVASGLL